ncbi:hypothetical protein E2553_35630 [Paraburkholderia dipogonis]|uniref:Uncharacterized protein n=1 Tax=Paraburkholderia dipogonis TaxID=1211383 RepID=A0A4Y8MX80_9BURK|nr:hypothetical protein [Paraburkholderia dipogonis]TFE41958.1 hypothetical protein E2553_35630 [Paraburkholderia dipogonis]
MDRIDRSEGPTISNGKFWAAAETIAEVGERDHKQFLYIYGKALCAKQGAKIGRENSRLLVDLVWGDNLSARSGIENQAKNRIGTTFSRDVL